MEINRWVLPAICDAGIESFGGPVCLILEKKSDGYRTFKKLKYPPGLISRKHNNRYVLYETLNGHVIYFQITVYSTVSGGV